MRARQDRVSLKYLSPQITERCPQFFFFFFYSFYLQASERSFSLTKKFFTNCPTKTFFYSFYLQPTLSHQKFLQHCPTNFFLFFLFLLSSQLSHQKILSKLSNSREVPLPMKYGFGFINLFDIFSLVISSKNYNKILPKKIKRIVIKF
jgi:hypothetical protein